MWTYIIYNNPRACSFFSVFLFMVINCILNDWEIEWNVVGVFVQEIIEKRTFTEFVWTFYKLAGNIIFAYQFADQFNWILYDSKSIKNLTKKHDLLSFQSWPPKTSVRNRLELKVAHVNKIQIWIPDDFHRTDIETPTV